MKTQIEFVNEDAKRLYEGKLEYKTEKSAGFDLIACYFYWEMSIKRHWSEEDKKIIEHWNNISTANTKQIESEINHQGSIKLESQESMYIGTGIKISPPEGYATFVYPRSSVATKNEIILLNSVGIIDNDYRGEIIVCLKNISDKPFKITLRERIAQAVIQPVLQADFKYVDKLDTTQRGEGGFGSTGK